MAAGDCGATTGGYLEKYFGSSGGAAATGIQQVWRGRGRRVGVILWQIWVREGKEMGFGMLGRRQGMPRWADDLVVAVVESGERQMQGRQGIGRQEERAGRVQ